MDRWGGWILLLAVLTGCKTDTVAVPKAPHEGVGSSGGGIGVICGDTVRTLDLYEATEVHGLTLLPGATTTDGAVLAVSKRLIRYLSSDRPQTDEELLAEIRKEVFGRFREVAPGSLALSQDATLPPLQPGCRFAQIALYEDERDVIWIDPSLWGRLDPLNQASLVLHESAYKLARQFKAKTSDETRRIVGLMASTTEIEPIYAGLDGREAILCSTYSAGDTLGPEGYWVTFFDDQEAGVAGLRVYATVLDGTFLLSRTTAFVPGASMANALIDGFPAMSLELRQPLIDREWHLEYEPLPGNAMAGAYFEGRVRASAVPTQSPDFQRVNCAKVTLRTDNSAKQ